MFKILWHTPRSKIPIGIKDKIHFNNYNYHFHSEMFQWFIQKQLIVAYNHTTNILVICLKTYIKNWEPFVSGPRLAIESKKGWSCFKSKFSSM